MTTKAMEQGPWKANSRSADNETPTFYGIRRFLTVFTRVRHWTLYRSSFISLHLRYLEEELEGLLV